MSTIEQKAASAALHLDEEIVVGKKKFILHKPTFGTIVLASAYISKTPLFELKSENIIVDVLRNAKDARSIGDVIASVIVGSKGMESKCFIGRFIKKRRFEKIARYVVENSTPSELLKLVYKLFESMEVEDFFAVIAFLNEINVTKATTTAYGQQSEVL